MDGIDQEKISAALMNDAGFVADTSSTLAVYDRLARELPSILADYHDEPLTFGSLMAAKAAVVLHFLKHGYIEAVVAALSDHDLGSMTREFIVASMYRQMPASVWTFEKMAGDPSGWLRANGVTEKEMLEKPRVDCLNAEAMAAYLAGTLTIGRLIGIQPGIFIKNNSDQ